MVRKPNITKKRSFGEKIGGISLDSPAVKMFPKRETYYHIVPTHSRGRNGDILAWDTKQQYLVAAKCITVLVSG